MPLERIIEFTPAMDKRKEGYGIHGVDMRFLVKGELGVIQFVVYTNWHLPHVTKEHESKAEAGIHPFNKPTLFSPLPADLGYHSPRPLYEDQGPMGECPYLDGNVCYYDGSGLMAEKVFDLLKTEGGEAVWKRLEQEYDRRFIEVAA